MLKTYPRPSEINTSWAFEHYQTIRHTLPKAGFPQTSQWVEGLTDLADDFDVFLLDAFGVLNVGQTSIKTAPAAVSALQLAGKKVMVLTNGASLPASESEKKFKRMGFDFDADHIITSRNALCNALAHSFGAQNTSALWGVMARPDSQLHELPAASIALGDDGALFDTVSGFILLGASYWTQHRQQLLMGSLIKKPRPVWVGNPDLVAPNEHHLSLEPGYFAHQLSQINGVSLHFFGKPFANIFQLACQGLEATPRRRILMVGDTLHTDILGGAAYGIKTALVTGHGLFAKQDITPYITQSGIVPDYMMVSP